MADEEPDVAVEATEEVAEVEIEMSVLDALKTVCSSLALGSIVVQRENGEN
jgi:hypothetical protein